MNLKATVIVPTFSLERSSDAIAAVKSLVEQTYKNKEIIVVVDGNKRLYDRLKISLPPTVMLVLNLRPGSSNARNTGIRHATGDIIAFIDDDVVVEKNWLAMHIRNYDKPAVIAAGGCIKPLWLEGCSGEFPEELLWIIGCTHPSFIEKNGKVRNNFGGNFSFKKQVFQKICFPTSFQNTKNKVQGAEDTEFCIRALQVFPDSEIRYDSDAVAYHRIYPYRLSMCYMLKRAFAEGSSKAYIAKLFKQQTLNRERTFLVELVKHLLPKRIRNILRGEKVSLNTKHFGLIVTVLMTVLLGYLVQTVLQSLQPHFGE